MTVEELDMLFENLESLKFASDDAESQVVAMSYRNALITANTFIYGASGLPNTRPDKYEYMIHAEANLVYASAKRGESLDGEIVLCTLSPCQNCIRAMFQSGVREIYYKDLYRLHDPNMRDIKVIEEPFGKYTKMMLTTYEET